MKEAMCPTHTHTHTHAHTHTKRGKKKKKGIGHEHFCPLNSLIFSFQFSLHLEEKTFWCTKRGKKKKKGIGHEHFCPLNSPIFSFQFSLHLEEKTFWWAWRENTQVHYLFSFIPTQPNTLKKVFLPIFSPKFSIHSISPLNKHTLTI